MSLRATPTARRGGYVIAGDDTQIADLVAQGIPVDTHGFCRSSQVAIVRAQHGDDVLLLEFTLGLVEGYTSTHQFIDKLKESSV